MQVGTGGRVGVTGKVEATAARHLPAQLCFLKDDWEKNRPEGQETRCQGEVNVWLLTRINMPPSCGGSSTPSTASLPPLS